MTTMMVAITMMIAIKVVVVMTMMVTIHFRTKYGIFHCDSMKHKVILH